MAARGTELVGGQARNPHRALKLLLRRGHRMDMQLHHLFEVGFEDITRELSVHPEASMTVVFRLGTRQRCRRVYIAPFVSISLPTRSTRNAAIGKKKHCRLLRRRLAAKGCQQRTSHMFNVSE